MKRDYGVLRAVMAFALDRDVIGRTPCRGTRLPSAEPVDGRLINSEELAALAEALGTYGAMAYIGRRSGFAWARWRASESDDSIFSATSSPSPSRSSVAKAACPSPARRSRGPAVAR